MSESDAQHLSPAEILEAAAGGALTGFASAHLESCAACRDALEEWRGALAELAPLRAPPDAESPGICPPAEVLARYAAGAEPERAGEILEHVARCARCAAVVSGGTEQIDSAAAPALGSSAPKWRRGLAERMAARASHPAKWRRYAAAAAVAVLAIGGTAWWILTRRSDPALLLARAYTASRPFEYRMGDDGFGPVRQQRGGAGSVFGRPAALAEAEDAIRRRLAERPDSPDTLALEGRADLLERNYEEAIASLSRALQGKPGDAALRRDLACAYALRGDVEGRKIDYGQALELLLQSLRARAGDGRTLYNLAIVYEKLGMVDQAIDAWDRFLATAEDAGWAGEARKRRAALEKLRGEKRKAGNGALESPQAFLAQAQSADFDPDRYQESFWRVWLPAADRSPAARRAAEVEARAFAEHFGDGSLRDTLHAFRGPRQAGAAGRLASLIAANQAGQNDAAAADAPAVAAALSAAGLEAGALRARLELAYSYQRGARRNLCLALAAQVVAEAGRRMYPWLADQALLEHAACAEALARVGEARAEVERARLDLERRGLRSAALRALGFVTGLDSVTGNYVPIWSNATKGLEAYWSGAASDYRAQEFLYDLFKSAQHLGWRESAVVLSRAAIASLRQVENPEMEAADRGELAALLGEAGDHGGQLEELRKAAQAASRLPEGPSRDDLEWNLELSRVEAGVDAGASGLESDLQKLAARASARRSTEQIRLLQASGRTAMARRDWAVAAAAFRAAIGAGEQRAGALHSLPARVAERETVAAAYRGLAQIQALEQHDPAAALATWRRYHERPAPGPADADGVPEVTLAVLPAGIVVWRQDGAKVRARRLDVPAKQVLAEGEKFTALCADPRSSQREIRSLGRRLFGWLLAPELAAAPTRRLRIDADAALAALPLEALNSGGGEYLGRSLELSYAVGGGRARPATAVGRASRVLVVSAPAGEAPGGAPLAVLADANTETADVAGQFEHAVVLRGAAADPAAIAARAAEAAVFHFAGHGWSDGGNGALILPVSGAGEPRFLTSREIAALDWKGCALAVLSACLTGAGEQRGAVNNQSLVRALLGAGAGRVVAARWTIDSASTAALMHEFYATLLRGETPAAALSRASAATAARVEWRHPYYWAAFQDFEAQ